MTCAEILGRAAGASLLVVGDICLDRWCRYDPSLAEESRETGIPRIAVTGTEVTPGAGGTVAANLARLGAGRVSVLGVTGRDGHAGELRGALSVRGIESDLLVEADAVQTFTYTKLINLRTGAEDLPRVDFVNSRAPRRETEERVLDAFRQVVGSFDGVVVADQAETDRGGVVTPRLRDAIAREAAASPRRVFVADSRRRVRHFRGVVAAPNQAEAEAACVSEFGSVDYRRLRRMIGGPALVVSAGERGAWLVDTAGARLFEACAGVEPVDTCGAGDSLAAGFALALAAGAGTEDALRFGIIVAGVTVGKPGTGSASPGEVLSLAESAAGRE